MICPSISISFLNRDLSRSILRGSAQYALTKRRSDVIIIPLSRMMLLQSARRKHGQKGSLPGGRDRSGCILGVPYLRLSEKPRFTRSLTKPVSPRGAIYTRYKNKDALFGSLLQDFLIRLFGMPFCRKVHPARGLTHFYRNTLVDFATNLVALVYCASLSFFALWGGFR